MARPLRIEFSGAFYHVTPRGNLSQILHHINGAYTTYFNINRGRSDYGRYREFVEKGVGVELESPLREVVGSIFFWD